MYTVTINGKTFEQFLGEIQNLGFVDVWREVADRIYPSFLVDNFNNGDETGELFYKNLQFYQYVSGQKVVSPKIPWTSVLVDVDAIKIEKTSALTSKFNLLQQNHDLDQRLEAIVHWKQASAELSLYDGYENKEVWKQAIISASDESAISDIEQEDAVQREKAEFKARVSRRARFREFGGKMIDTISELNEANSITPTQLQALFASPVIQQAMTLLQAGSLKTAKAFIAAMDLTGLDPITEVERAIIVNSLSDFLGE